MKTKVVALLGAVLALLLVAGCGGGSKAGHKTPAEVMAAAKATFDKASSVHVDLATDQTPDSGNGILSAAGTLTRQPAFQGKADVLFRGLRATVPVTAIGGKIYVQLPLSSRYTAIDPADFGIPDPAQFIDPDKGISRLLTELSGLKKGKQTRDGNRILTEYTGTLTAARVKAIIPMAVAGDYATVVGVDDKDVVRNVEVTGPFFGKGTTVTYRISLSDYDKAVTIKKP